MYCGPEVINSPVAGDLGVAATTSKNRFLKSNGGTCILSSTGADVTMACWLALPLRLNHHSESGPPRPESMTRKTRKAERRTQERRKSCAHMATRGCAEGLLTAQQRALSREGGRGGHWAVAK